MASAVRAFVRIWRAHAAERSLTGGRAAVGLINSWSHPTHCLHWPL